MEEKKIEVTLEMYGVNPIDYAKAIIDEFITPDCAGAEEDLRRRLLFVEEIASHINVAVDSIKRTRCMW